MRELSLGSYVTTRTGVGKIKPGEGTAGGGKGLIIPRYGLESVPVGVVTATCTLKGETSTNRLFSMATCCESKKMPKPERMLVLPARLGSKAKPTRGEKFR